VASIGGYFYSTGKNLIAVHLYGGSSATVDLDGNAVSIRETSNYPWLGQIAISVDPKEAAEFTLKVRIPSWAEVASVTVNGQSVDVARQTEKGYLAITRRWAAGDKIEMDLPMPVRRLYAHPRVRTDIGRVALARGPLVYCIEQHDHPHALVSEIRLPREALIEVKDRKDLLGGVQVLTASATALKEADWSDTLYRSKPPLEEPATLTAIPYYIWNNRGPNRMQVWISEKQ
jgi:DUF1680 family protein